MQHNNVLLVRYSIIQYIVQGVTAKMQMAKLSFCHFLALGHLICKILVPTPVINRELWGVGTRNMKIKCSEVKKRQKQSLAVCIFAVTPFSWVCCTLQLLQLCLYSNEFDNLCDILFATKK
jgi:hypothetical protein